MSSYLFTFVTQISFRFCRYLSIISMFFANYICYCKNLCDICKLSYCLIWVVFIVISLSGFFLFPTHTSFSVLLSCKTLLWASFIYEVNNYLLMSYPFSFQAWINAIIIRQEDRREGLASSQEDIFRQESLLPPDR